MTNKRTSTGAAAKSAKAMVAKRRKQLEPANGEGNAIGQSKPRTGAGTRKQKEPFVL